jgi:cytoskeletal protein RodZ
MTIRKQAITTVAFLLLVAIFGLNAIAQNDASQASTSTASTSTTSTSSTTTASTSKGSASKTSRTASTPVQTQTPPQPGMVWVNTASGTYHKSDRWYGKTKEGKFMTEADAVKAGYKSAKN